MFVALKDSLFRFDAGVLSLNSSYSFVLRVAKDRRVSFFIQRVQPIASNFTSLDEVGSQLDALLASGDNDAVLFVAGRASEELNNVVSLSEDQNSIEDKMKSPSLMIHISSSEASESAMPCKPEKIRVP